MNKYLSSPFLRSKQIKSQDSSRLISPNYQKIKINSFNYIELVAVSGNNVKQELRNLFTTVSHRTIADVFLCLSFSNLPVMGELRLALALVRLWWGGRGNKPLGVNTACRCCSGFEPPCRPTFRANNHNITTLRKGTTK
jgi:hypothetical protein